MGEALDVVRQQYDLFLRQDWEAHRSLYHPDVEVDLSRSGIRDLGTYSGYSGLQRGWRRWRGVWERYELELEELIESADRVLGLTRLRVRSRGQGLETAFRGADLFRVRDGLIVQFTNYLDREAARRDAGF